MSNQVKAPSSQQKFVDIKEIKDDVVLLKNGGLRAILMTTSINFALKSTEEQEALIIRFQDFLNSLDFSIQILVTSRKFNIDNYINALREKQYEQQNELLKVQTLEYINFIKELTEMTNIMSESFYVVVPYSRQITQTKFLKKIFSSKQQEEDKPSTFQETKNNLWQRLDFVITGLQPLDIQAVPLKTNELIELFYTLYNPAAKEEVGALAEKQQ